MAIQETKYYKTNFDFNSYDKKQFWTDSLWILSMIMCFYNKKSKSCNIIDFDDAMYHWYVMDIEQSLDSLQDCIPPEMIQQKKQCFLDGLSDRI